MYSNPDENKQLFTLNNLEGVFTTWAWRWTRAITDTSAAPNVKMFHIDEANLLIYFFWTSLGAWRRFGIYNLLTGAVIFESVAGAHHYVANPLDYGSVIGSNQTSYTAVSNRERYVVLLRNDIITLEIYKDGTLIQSIDITTYIGGAQVWRFCMSNSGKWLLVATLNNILMFEGT